MYLKGLELYGFKSFAERTELQFGTGVTAVVGPNGSGKSNVSDAVRWVLGEQSAKSLRGGKMEDIIFSGSDSRKAVNYAEVMLILDNTDQTLPLDYSEVSVARRVYRTGESEYLMNKQPCRLKDITELFMDTGLGKEAYSIIGQGRIDEILSTKAEDRRGIFEEAAGVMKYKNRKKETVRKLEDTESNLVRIQDIVHEVEDQIGPLEEQASKAKQYKELKNELQAKEIGTFVHQIETLHHEWEKDSQDLQDLRGQLDVVSVDLNQQDAHFEERKWGLSQLEQEIDKAQQHLLELTEEVEKIEGKREVLKERKKNFSYNRQEIVQQLQAIQAKRAEKDKEYELEQTHLNECQAEVTELEQALHKQEESFVYSTAQIEEQIEHVQGEYIDHLNEKASLKNELRHHEQKIEQLRLKLKQLDQDHQQMIAERTENEHLIEQVQAELSHSTTEIEQLRQAYKLTQREKQVLTQSMESKEETYRQALSQWEQKQSRLAFLKEMKDDFAGFLQGVKEVLKARKAHLNGINGAIAELIEVPKRVQVAVETALGPALQHVVVQDEAAGRQAIHYLKQRQLGRATFLPLTVIKPRTLSAHDRSVLESQPGFVGLASELITYAKPYDAIIRNLLGVVVITDSLEQANKMAKALHYRYRFVTLEGDVVNPGGAMTGGGSKKNQNNLLGREKEIDHLTAVIAQRKKDLDVHREDIMVCKKQLADFDEHLINKQHQAEQLKEKEQEKRDQLSQIVFTKKRLDEKLEIYDQDQTSLSSELQETAEAIEQGTLHIQEYEANSERLEADMQRLEEQKKSSETNKDKSQEELTRTKVQCAQKQQELEGARRQVERIQTESQQLSTEQEHLQQHLLELEGNIGSQDEQENELDRTFQIEKEEKAKRTEEIMVLRQQRKTLQDELEESNIEIKQKRKEQREMEELFHKIEVKVNRLDVELETILTLLREEYELSYELAKERYALEQDYAIVKQEVDQLKKRIQALGDVNLGAIEEYERLNERYLFLQSQENDLVQAKTTLYEIIAEMDEEMTKRFQETFDQVRSKFLEVFQRLFGGGRADLLLHEPDDLLNTGVDIVAQPPGKKLQHLGLLSGGERALTAITLLFAILKVKPVPFCILDEVEAALDEANVSRFARYLKEFSRETQFIVITHRKGTMEEADVLYGITMQESGVSNLVSVKLEGLEDVITA